MTHQARTFDVAARPRFGRREVAASDLEGGLLTISLADAVPGAWIELEAGASLSGIKVIDSSGADVTADGNGEWVTMLQLVAAPSPPHVGTLVHDDLGVDAQCRLWIPSLGAPGTFGDASYSQHQTVIIWDGALAGGVGRWRVAGLAP